MAVYSWIYANVKKKGDEGDYLIRRCDPGLEKYQSTMKTISRRMLSTEKRYGAAERQICWFSGFLDSTLYVAAVAGMQEELLGTSLAGGGFRRQYCVLAYGFTGEDIGLYRREAALFEPLKEELCEIQGAGEAPNMHESAALSAFFSEKRLLPVQMATPSLRRISDREKGAWEGENRRPAAPNILKSTSAADEEAWEGSLLRPAATGLLSVEDAKKMLDLFPDGMMTVAEDTALSYRRESKDTDRLKRQLEQEAAQEERRKREQAALEQRTEEMRQEIRVRQEEAALPKKSGKRIGWLLAGVLAGIFLYLAFH